MKFFKLTTAEAVGDGELIAGQPIHINVSRTQAFFKVKKGDRHRGMTKFIMNTPDEIFYVKESPDDIREQLKSMNDGLD